MSRLPVIENPNNETENVSSYISARADVKQRVREVQSASKLELKRLNNLRTQYAKERGLFTPGVDFILKLLEEFPPESARQWLSAFDVAREVTNIDDVLGGQTNLLEGLEQEETGRELAEAVA